MKIPPEILACEIFKHVNNRLILSLVCKKWASMINYAYPRKNKITEYEYYLRIALNGHRRVLKYLDPELHSHIYRPTTGTLHVLKIATNMHKYQDYCWDKAVVNQAIQFCDVEYLIQLLQRGWGISDTAIISATISNNLNMVQFLLENDCVDILNGNIQKKFGKKAGETGDKEMINEYLEWFSMKAQIQCGLASGGHFDKITNAEDPELLFKELAKIDRLDLIRKFNLPPSSAGILAAAVRGHKNIVREYPSMIIDSAYAIGEGGHFDMLDLLRKNNQINKDTFFDIVKNHKYTGRLDVIRWYEENIEISKESIIIYASCNKNIEVFRYAISKYAGVNIYFNEIAGLCSLNVAKYIIRENPDKIYSNYLFDLMAFARTKILNWILSEYGDDAKLWIQSKISKKINKKMILWLRINGISSNLDIAQKV